MRGVDMACLICGNEREREDNSSHVKNLLTGERS